MSTLSRSVRTLGVILAALALAGLATGCGESTEPLPDGVIAQLDIANNAIADLTTDADEDVPRPELMQSVLRAQTAGTTMRIVVTPADGELVSAKAVVDRYGGTAITYQAGRPSFEAASRDMSSGQIDRAVDAAKLEVRIERSASAFVDVLETEGLEEPGSDTARLLLWLALIPAALFMVSGAWSYMQARKRRNKRASEFARRKAVLADWAAQLGPEVESLRTAVAASPDTSAQRSWHDAQEFVSGIGPTLDAAQNVGDLDVAEMRIGRTAIKLRDLRRSLENA